MRHRVKGFKFNRKAPQLKALMRNLLTSFILEEKIITTESKAKFLSSSFDKLVSKGRLSEKREAIRSIKKILFGECSQRKFINDIIPNLKGKSSGFTTRSQIGFRRGDAAPLFQISLLRESN
jgi:large subunit ribosomal protein L17